MLAVLDLARVCTPGVGYLGGHPRILPTTEGGGGRRGGEEGDSVPHEKLLCKVYGLYCIPHLNTF